MMFAVRKGLVFATVSLLLLLCMPTAVALQFDDAASVSEWAVPYVSIVSERGIMQGSGGLFRPKAVFTRAELASVLVRLDAAPPAEVTPVFEDAAEDAWFYDAVTQAAAKEYMLPVGRSFRPDDAATRQEVAFAFSQLLGLDEERAVMLAEANALIVEDLSEADELFAPALLAMSAEGLMVGHQGYLRPKDSITREEMAKIVALVLT